MATAQDHPAGDSWTPAPPPPPRPRLAPGLLAGVMALALLLGAVGLVAARQAGSLRDGASSPEAAARGLLGALDRDRLDAQTLTRAARYLAGEERVLVTTYADRLGGLLTGARAEGGPLQGLGFGARDVRFQRVAGGDDVSVLEAVDGTFSVRTSGGGRLEIPLDEARRRVAEQTGGAITSLRLVTVREKGRWYVSALATGLELARLAARGGQVDYGKLVGEATPGATSPEAAVQELAASLDGQITRAVARLAPAERRALEAYLPALQGGTGPARTLEEVLGQKLDVDVSKLRTRTERLADGVVRVHLVGGEVRARAGDGARQALRLDRPPAGEPAPYVVSIQRGGTWYPSIVFTVTDVALTSAEREHP